MRVRMPRRDDLVAPAVVMVFLAATFAGFVAVYFLLFQTANCRSKNFACLVNNNKGLVTLYALLIAVASVSLSAFVLLRNHRGVRSRFKYVLTRAVDEACHNLRHISDSFDNQHLRSSPEYTLRTARELVRDPLEFHLRRSEDGLRLWEHIDHMIRNDEVLKRLQLVSRRSSSADPTLLLAEDPTKYLVEHMLRFVLDATRLFPGEAESVLKDARATDDLEASPLLPVLEAVQQNREPEPFVRFARSKVLDRISKQKPSEYPRVAWCWDGDDDKKLPFTEVKAVGKYFAALADPP